MDAGIVLPENLLFLGVADYPLGEPMPGWERFRESYLGFETKGCRFFPLQAFEGEYVRLLREFLSENIKTTNVYVSLDLDVGAQRCVHAARYMDWPGMEKKINVYRDKYCMEKQLPRLLQFYNQVGKLQFFKNSSPEKMTGAAEV